MHIISVGFVVISVLTSFPPSPTAPAGGQARCSRITINTQQLTINKKSPSVAILGIIKLFIIFICQ